MKNLKIKLISGVAVALIGTVIYEWLDNRKVHIPDYVELIDGFDVQQYMGKWYEIARLDFKYEKDLSHVSATYFLNKKGMIEVFNRGYNYKEKKWKEAQGKATFNDQKDKSALKVSFFGPFYSGYNVVMMDPDYETALVFGEKHDYMWILSRNKTIPEHVKQKFLDYAQQKGYNISQLVWTNHE